MNQLALDFEQPAPPGLAAEVLAGLARHGWAYEGREGEAHVFTPPASPWRCTGAVARLSEASALVTLRRLDGACQGCGGAIDEGWLLDSFGYYCRGCETTEVRTGL